MAFHGLVRSDWRRYEPNLVDILSPLGFVHKPLPSSEEAVLIYKDDLPRIATNVGILVEQSLDAGVDVIAHLTLGSRWGFIDSSYVGGSFNIDLYERMSIDHLNIGTVLRGFVEQQVSQVIPRSRMLYEKSSESVLTVKVIEEVRQEVVSNLSNRDCLLYVCKEGKKTKRLSYRM